MRTLLTAPLALALTACAGSKTATNTTPTAPSAVAPRDDCPEGWTLQSNPHGSACARPGQEVSPDCQPARCAVTGYLMWNCPEPVRQPESAPTLVSLGYDNFREGAPGAGITFALSPPISAEFPHGADRFMAEIQLTTSCQDDKSQPIFQQDHHRLYVKVPPAPQFPSVIINGNTVGGEIDAMGYTFTLPEGLSIRGLWLYGYFLHMALKIVKLL